MKPTNDRVRPWVIRTGILLLLLAFPLVLPAQHAYPWEQYYDELISAEDETEAQREENLEQMSRLAEQPIDLNTATREDLARIPFLSDVQIEDILAHVYLYHGMRSLGELLLIPSVDYNTCRLLCYFVCLSPIEDTRRFSFGNALKYGKHTLLLTTRLPFYDRRGDINGYLGYKYTHSLRYNYHYSDYLQLGVVGAQQAGEPFFANKNAMGYDHYSLYAIARKLGRIKTLAIGDYRIRFGEGLILNNDFVFGKLASLTSFGKTGYPIHAHASRSAANYLQGVAATVELVHHLDLTAFVSYRHLDATLNSDGTVRTLLRSDEHRTETEMKKKDNTSQTATGGNLRWTYQGLHLGASALYTQFSRPLAPPLQQAYRKYDPAGTDFQNFSFDYGYFHPRFTIDGEVATGSSGSIATLNCLRLRPSQQLSLIAVQRYYGYKYHSIFANSFSEGRHVQNESGLLVGGNWQVDRFISLLAYTDYAYFSHPRYRVSRASHVWDNFVSAVYARGNCTLSARYRLKIGESNAKSSSQLISNITQYARLSFIYTAEKWSSKTLIDFARNHYLTTGTGYMLSEHTTVNPTSWLSLTASFAYFHTDSYASRIYSYERGPLYSFRFSAYYGTGIHYALFLRSDISSRWMVIVRLSTTDYFDRNHISSGLQQIPHSSMTDLELQLRVKI